MAVSKLTKINVIGLTLAISGVLSFFVLKRTVKKQRVESMKARERMAKANFVFKFGDTLQNFIMALNNMPLDASKMQLVQNLEIEMMSDMYNRMAAACQQKCISPRYSEADLAKGESVCLDRCVAKYLEVHERIGRKLTSISTQDEEIAKKLLEQQKSASN